MDHIYELKQSNYTFDLRLSNPEPLSYVVLPETEELDMSYIKEEINRIKSNRVIVWKMINYIQYWVLWVVSFWF